MATKDQDRVAQARAAAYKLGFRLVVLEVVNVEPFTHEAAAAPITVGDQGTWARFLTYGFSAGEAAETGLGILRGVVERGEPWPRESR